MNILLTGSTGFLGFRTLEKLVDRPDIQHIKATGRTLDPARVVSHSKVAYQLGNLEDAAFADELVRGVDVIINTASLSSPWGSIEAFENANLRTQSNLLAAAKKHQVSRFIYISSPSIYYNGQNRIGVKETDPLPEKFVNHYSRTKFAAEQLLEKASIPFVILRPRAIIGRGDRIIMPRLIRAFDEGKLRIIGSGDNIVDLSSVSNVADATILSLKAGEKALNHAYNITNGEPVKLWDQVDLVLRLLQRELGNRKLPFWIAHTLAGILEWKSKLTNQSEPALTRYGIGTLARSFTLDISKARDQLGYNPGMNTATAIQEFTNWYQQNENL